MKKQKLFTILTLVLASSLGFQSCSKEKMEKRQSLKALYKTYENGQISECTCNGQTVFSAGLNAYDAGTVIYDKEGNQIGTCNYGWGSVDSICTQLTNCETVYCIKDNIWGEPTVNKYYLK